ncbi:MAG TPA: hypothetical protein VFE46_13675 [Pirellulales bacterium]|jgi:hypothetical protein|nr:hypothetical protein [Pirellulales bacterium]
MKLPLLRWITGFLSLVLAGTNFTSIASAGVVTSHVATLYVSDLNGDPYFQQAVGRVLAFDATTGQYLRTVVTGLTVPSAVTIGPGGLLYVADAGTGQVLTFNPSATDQSATAGGVYASGIITPGGLLYDRSDNSMFVSQEIPTQTGFLGEDVKHYDANGNLITTDGTAGVIGIGTGSTGRAGMALDSNHNLYVGTLDTNTGNVLKFTASDHYNTSSVFASGALGASQMLFYNGNLLVDAQFEGAVLQYDSSGVLTANNPFITLVSQAFNSGLIAHGTNGLIVSGIGSGTGPGQIGIYNIDTGAPLHPDSDTFITKATVDAGIAGNAYFQPTSSFVYYVPGDLNLDGVATSNDINTMLSALIDLSGYQTSHDLSDDELLQIADLNHDGKVTNADLQGLLDLLKSEGSSAVSGVPEPSSCVLASLAFVAVFNTVYRRRSQR